MASWDGELQRRLRTLDNGPEQSSVMVMVLACSCAISSAATVAVLLAVSAGEALKVCLATRLVQGSGRLQIERLMTAVQGRPAGASTQFAHDLLTGSVMAQFEAMS